MRRLSAMFCASLVLAGLLLVPLASGASAANLNGAGFLCGPHGTTEGTPTTSISTANISQATPTMTCLFRGTHLPASFGGTCVYDSATVHVDFTKRLLLPVNNNTNLICSGGTASIKTDLSITKTDGAATAVPGTTTTYTIVASNAGTVPGNAVVADTFPAAITGTTWTSVAAGGATGNTASGTGNVNETLSLPAGASVTYTVVATIDPSATGSLANTATITAGTGTSDTNAANNSATDTDTLTPQADIAVTVDDGVTTIPAGGNTLWTVTITNNGPSTAHLNAGFGDPFGFTNCGDSGGGVIIGWGAQTLAPGASTSETAQLAGVSGTGTVVESATASASETDPNPANNTASDTDNCTPLPPG